MNPRFLVVVAALAFLTANAAIAQAPAAQSAQAQPAQPAAAAQTPAQDSAGDPSSQQPPQKKVWTNEDLSTLDPHQGVSTIGSRKATPAKRTAPAKGNNANWYRNQIVALQAKIPPIDSQIAELQAGLDGKSAGDGKQSTRPYYTVKADDWSRQLAELQKKRGDILAQIGVLQDQARHNGVPPNALP
jgi:hypothetical protein